MFVLNDLLNSTQKQLQNAAVINLIVYICHLQQHIFLKHALVGKEQ